MKSSILLHPTIKGGMRKMKAGDLSTKLARFLFNYRITPQSTTGVSPAELLMGRRLQSAFDSIKPDLNRRVEREWERQKTLHDRHCTMRTFEVGDMVYARNYGSGSKWVQTKIRAGTIKM